MPVCTLLAFTAMPQHARDSVTACTVQIFIVIVAVIVTVRKLTGYSSSQTHLIAVGTHRPYVIMQCYLSPSRGDYPPFTPAN